jgi:predicted MFS family arabinose efflux permease
MSSLWLAFNAQWLTIAPIVVPQAVANMSADYRELWSGLTIAAGAVVAAVVPPVAGALTVAPPATASQGVAIAPSAISGVLAGAVALLALGWALSASVVAVVAAYLVLQLCWNWAAGPYAGLIPDVVDPAQRAEASGWLNVMTILGTVVGTLALTLVFSRTDPWPMTAVWIGLSLICLVVTLRAVPEPVPVPPEPWPGVGRFVRSFYLPWADNRAFYWVLITRLLNNFGVWSVLAFLVLYLQFVLGMTEQRAGQLTTALLGVGAVLGVAGSLATAMLVRRYGPVNVVRAVSWIMAVTVAGYLVVAAVPRLWLIVLLVPVYALVYGVYGAADWALALRVLPDGRDAGKDFGVWHICLVLPQALGSITTGTLITVIREVSSARIAYGMAFAVAAVWFIAAALLVSRIRLDRENDTE